MAVADPNWGAELAGQEVERDGEAVRAFERDCEARYFGHPLIQELRDPNGQVLRPPQMVGRTAEAMEDSRAMGEDLDRLAGELRRRGYEVGRMPYLALKAKEAGPARKRGPEGEPNRAAGERRVEEGEKEQPRYPEMTYNNVLLEREGGKDIVYLPQYGWAALDEAARQAWEGLGYAVRPVGGLAISATYGGSLRCCVKVLARGESPSGRGAD